MNKNKSLSEIILVVEKKKLFNNINIWTGLNKEIFEKIKINIINNKQFMIREKAESDNNFKQIIPYLVFKYQNKYFLMQRKKSASEESLASKYSLGIGGHIKKEDIVSENIYDWAKREFNEEVNYSGNLKVEEFGILNDDSSQVGNVHIGIVFILEGDNEKITIKDEHKSGKLFTLKDIKEMKNIEPWSNYIITNL